MVSPIPENEKNQDSLLIINELKKVNQGLSDIKLSIEKSKKFNLQTKLLFGNLISISILLIAGLALNFYLYKQQLKQLKQLQKLEELQNLQNQKLDNLSSSEQYEYKVVAPSDYLFDEEMNNYGKQGWKAAECRRATSSFSFC